MTTRALDTANENPEQSGSWSGVLAIAVCAFALVASEFLPVSLLTPIANDLGTTEGMAGQGIAISGAFAVLTSLFISSVAGSLNRKTLLLGLTAAMGMSGAIVALAPNYFVYMLGRALIGIVIGGFWSMSAATAMRLVPANDVPRALALVNGGNALATVVAAPLGAWLGTLIGWRGAFLCLVPVALVALAWQWTTLPSMRAGARAPGPGNVFTVFALLKRPGVMLGMLASSLFFMGQFSLFTYVRPFLETVTGVHGAHVSLVLLVIGAAGFIGTLLIDRVLQQCPEGACSSCRLPDPRGPLVSPPAPTASTGVQPERPRAKEPAMRPAPEDAADDAFDQREYPIPERLESQRRAWRFERAGLWVLLGVILLALTGVFAGGPLSSRTLVSDSGRLTLAYERFERSGAASRLRIDLRGAPGTEVGVRLGGGLLQAHSIQSLQPQPLRSHSWRGGLELEGRLDEDGRLSLFLTLLPNQLGEVASRLEFAGESLAFDQFIYP